MHPEETSIEIEPKSAFGGSLSAGSSFTMEYEVSSDNGVDWSEVFVAGDDGETDWCGAGIPTVLENEGETILYEMTCTVPADAVNGMYALYIGAADLSGNWYQAALPFVVGGGSSDATAPVVSDITAPATVTRSASFTITYRVTDESGVANLPGGMPFALVRLVKRGYEFGDDDDIEEWFTLTAPVSRTSGDDLDGLYEQAFRGNGETKPGTYELWLVAADRVGNMTFAQTGTSITVTR